MRVFFGSIWPQCRGCGDSYAHAGMPTVKGGFQFGQAAVPCFSTMDIAARV